jgi:lipoprotein NlpD
VVLSPKKNTQKEKQTSILKEKVNAPLKINPPKANIVSVKPFITPVKGTITNFYVQDKGSNNNNGIDYETKTEAPVKAVADGEIVLISDIVGGKGKIVLIRHTDELITIYGRLTNLEIKKGQKVTQGQKIGEVIKNESNNFGTMHFEVRQGMKSIDPETMLR